jgi:PIN domain nuclease of toxin-antitoxin system
VTFLVDTHLVLWTFFEPKKLPAQARAILESPKNKLVYSTVVLWEIGIKRGLGKKEFQVEPRVLRRTLLDDDYEELPVLGQHAVEVDILPRLHKDPFDRILIAQALVEGITLLTADPVIAQYPGPIRKV